MIRWSPPFIRRGNKSLINYTLLDFYAGFSNEEANLIEEYDAFYFRRKTWKMVTEDFCGQIVQNIGKELE